MKKVDQILDFKLLDTAHFTLTVFDIFFIVIVFLIAKLIIKSFEVVLNKKLADKGGSKEGQGKSIIQIVKYIVYVLIGFVTIESIGIDISILAAFIATLGIGLGFALQDLFKDIISGIIMLFEGSVKVGDILEVDGLVGNVKEIKLRTSELRTRDGIYIVIPNSRIINEKVINWSASSKVTRFSVTVGVAYTSDIEKVKTLLLKSVEDNSKILKRPTPIVIFNDFGDSALEFQLWFWVNDTWGIEATKSEIRFNINRIFNDNNIQIPFPQRDIHVIEKQEDK